MNKKEIKALEVKIQEVTGLENVEIVRPTVVKLDMVKDPSIDIQLLEIENKLNALRNKKSARQIRAEKKAESRARIADKLSGLVDKAVEKMEGTGPALMKLKPVHAVMDYFFDIEEWEEQEQEYEIVGHYDHHKKDAIEDGNVVFLNRDFKQLK